MERELLAATDLVDDEGRLRAEARGWSRWPRHRCNLRGHALRKKRWDYWCITTRDHLLAVTIADIDWLGLATVTFFEYATRRPIERVMVRPLGLGVAMPELPRGGDLVIDGMGVHVAVREELDRTRIEAAFEPVLGVGSRLRADVVVERPPEHETLNVVVPFDDGARYQMTSKQTALPARGRVVVDGRGHAFTRENEAFACLDYGRGVWPWRTTWNWGSAAGTRDGRTIGLNLGGQWTDGTGATENGVVIDGRMHKLSERVDFAYDRADFMRPWRVRSPRVDLVFEPSFERTARANLGLLAAELHWCLGTWRGSIVDDDGRRVAIDDLLGWSEEVRARW